VTLFITNLFLFKSVHKVEFVIVNLLKLLFGYKKPLEVLVASVRRTHTGNLSLVAGFPDLQANFPSALSVLAYSISQLVTIPFTTT
jgi:hypothetical protein